MRLPPVHFVANFCSTQILLITQKLATKCIGGNPIRSYYKKKKKEFIKKKGKKDLLQKNRCTDNLDAIFLKFCYWMTTATGNVQMFKV